MGYEVEKLPIEPKQVAKLSLAEATRSRGDRVENRLEVGWGPRDHSQDPGRGLLLYCLAQRKCDLGI
jgi:hypothetical protein